MGWNICYRVSKVSWLSASLGMLIIAGCAVPAVAQNVDPVSGLQQLRQQFGPSQNSTNNAGQAADQAGAQITLQPATPQTSAPLAPSRLEQILSARAGTKLVQFGYDQLGRGR